MLLDNAHNAKCFRYETGSGFAFETLNGVLPVFNPYDSRVTWYDFESRASDDLYFSRWLQRAILNERVKSIVDSATAAVRQENEANTNWLGLTAFPSLEPPTCASTFYVGTVVGDQIQFSLQCFGTYVGCVVEHNPGHAVLLAGGQYLVSRSERERTEASARDHSTHLEYLTLAREHSNQNFFSTLDHKLKEFGWRTWLRDLGLSNGASKVWSLFTSALPPCPSYSIVFSQMS
jgi:hypothetical protein